MVGFSGKAKDDEFTYKFSDTLARKDWEELFIDMRVQSVITLTKGTVVGLNRDFRRIKVDWDNGKHSDDYQKYFQNVIAL